MDTVFVTNRNDFYHEDRYDGVVYGFQPGEKLPVPVQAAVLMFGFGRADKTEALTRLGWANLPEEKGVQQLARFVFSEAQLVERVIGPDRVIEGAPAATADEA